MPLFGPKTKSPQELVKAVKESMAIVLKDKGEKETKKAMEELCKTLVSMRSILYSAGEQEAPTEQLSQLSVEMYSNDILPLLVTNLARIEFEGRKDVVIIFNNVVRRQIGTRNPTVEYLCTKPELLLKLMKGYEVHEIALSCGQMLRECCRAEELVKIMMNSPNFYQFFDYVELTTFDIASDAFSTFKELLTRHKVLSAAFLEQNYDTFFTRYSKLLCSENYVTRRQALKLLGELLLDRHNFSIMTRYISSPDNLKVMMTMLKDKSRNIQFEAFHVFKVFVANPNKPQPILDILMRNRDKLVEFLSSFHSDRSDDEQFNDEKAYLVKQIKDLKQPAGGPVASSATSPQAQDHPVDPGICQRQN